MTGLNRVVGQPIVAIDPWKRVFKKLANHRHAMALHFLYYNFVRIHQTLKMSPAMTAGVSKRL